MIAATNKKLETPVQSSRFRDDLYYRINVVKLQIPPLRERREDVPFLVEHFITRLNLLQGKEITGVSDEVLSCLMSYDYPGNVREFENIIERAFVFCRSGQIERQHITEPPPCVSTSEPSHLDGPRQLETAFLLSALRQNYWNRLETARWLCI